MQPQLNSTQLNRMRACSATSTTKVLLLILSNLFGLLLRAWVAQQIVRPGRKFVREGLIKVKRKQSRKSVRLSTTALSSKSLTGKSYLFLFQDILVHCEQVGKTKVVADDGEKPFNFVGILKLRDVAGIQSLDKEPRVFRLLTSDNQTWELKAPTAEDKVAWELDISKYRKMQQLV
jgi:hypothetical protein